MSGTKSTLIDLFRAFQTAAEKNRYPLSARATYYSILNAWNDERRPDCLRIRRGTLQDLTGLSESSVRNAIQFLANIGWIKLNRVHNKNAPLAVVLRQACEPSTLVSTIPPKTETERARAKAEPNEPRKSPSGNLLSSARDVLKRLSVKIDVSTK